MENSEKIFDETLTAFIRQNSSNQDLADVSFQLNDLTLESTDVYSNLPMEKRTISPPLQKRNNSSNISIKSLNPSQNRLSYNDSCYFSSSSSSCASSFGSEDNFSNLTWFHNSELFPHTINEQETSNLGLLNFDFMNNSSLAAFNSETSSERSDTPNSCVTTASSSYFTNFNNFGFDGFFPSENLDSSSSSTSTTVYESNKDDVQTPKKVSDSEEEKAKKSPKTNKKIDQQKRDGSYCGYVESFPYYYKLNRLYNALALQKMQTEKLKKAGMLNPANVNNPAAIAQAYATLQTLSPLGTSPTGVAQFGSSPPSGKPKQKNYKNFKRHQQFPTQQQQPLQQQAQQKFY